MKTKFSWFFMTWNVQGLWVLLSLGAALAAICSPKEVNFNVIHIFGFLIWSTGFLIEVIADNQKTKFRAKKENEDKFITTGLWSWSRHPNYFGEILLWFGVAIVALPSLEGWLYFALISPIFVFIQLTRISGVSLLEARGRKQWKGNEEYQRYFCSVGSHGWLLHCASASHVVFRWTRAAFLAAPQIDDSLDSDRGKT